MYISVGDGCNMAYQIAKHKEKRESLFFDWVTVNLDSVIKVMENIHSIETILNTKAINKIGQFESTKKSIVSLDTLDFFKSPHDMNIKFSKKDKEEFISKYKRRLERIKKAIEGDEKIFFCRASPEEATADQKFKFAEAVRSINKACRFTLVSVNYDQEERSTIREGTFLDINLDCRRLGKDVENAWTTDHMDWGHAFREIDKYG